MPWHHGAVVDIDALLRDDPRAFLRELKRQAEQGRRLAAARPQYSDVGQALTALAERFVGGLWGPVEPDAVSYTPLTPVPGSTGALEGNDFPTVNPDNSLVLEVAHGYATGLRDHLVGFALLASSNGPARPMLALSRVILDAAVHLLHIVSHTITEEERVSRALNVRLDALREEIADHQEGSQKHVSLWRDRQEILTHAEADGFQRESKRSKNGTESPAWYVEPHHRLDAIMSEALEGDHQATWRTLSSVVHAQERPDLRFTLGHQFNPGPHAGQMNMVHMALPLLIAIEAMKASERYFGLRGQGIDHGNLSQRVAATIAGASGLHDDEIRRNLGFQ